MQELIQEFIDFLSKSTRLKNLLKSLTLSGLLVRGGRKSIFCLSIPVFGSFASSDFPEDRCNDFVKGTSTFAFEKALVAVLLEERRGRLSEFSLALHLLGVKDVGFGSKFYTESG